MAPAALKVNCFQQRLAERGNLWSGGAASAGRGISPCSSGPSTNLVLLRRPAPCLASFSLSNTFFHHGSHHKTKAYAHDMKALVGTWVKDKDVSDSMKEAMDITQLGGIVRQAVKLVRGIKIEQDTTTWTMAVFSVISWFKVTERYALDGTAGQYKRRDLRSGKHTGRLLPDEPGPHGGLQIELQWGEPHAGKGRDEFVLAPRGTAAAQKKAAVAASAGAAGGGQAALPAVAPGDKHDGEMELHVYSSMVVEGRPCAYRTVYHKK